MGTTYRITDGTSSVDISPIRGQNDPENRGREVMTNKAGVGDAYDWGGKNVYEVPFNALSEANADQLITWWNNLTVLTFTPDLQGAPGTTKSVLIDEVPRPVQMWGGNWDTLFAGLITLYEVSSQSFSSSSQSVSGSRSCSASYSVSQSVGSSRSCSTGDVFSTSLSWSSSRSCSTSYSSSCENLVSISGSSSSDYRSCSTSGSISCSYSSSQVPVVVDIGDESSCSLNPSGAVSGSSSDFSSCSVSGAG
jgi:hypothetical protein